MIAIFFRGNHCFRGPKPRGPRFGGDNPWNFLGSFLYG